MASTALIEKRNALKEKAKFLHDVFEQAGDQMDMSKVTVLDGDSKAKTEKIKALNDELTELGKEVEQLADLDRIRKSVEPDDQVVKDGFRFPDAHQEKQPKTQAKTLSEHIIESKALGDMKGRTVAIEIDDVKTLFQTTAGWLPETTRNGMVVDYATRPLQVMDVVPVGRTDQSAVVYTQETTFTNAAAETAEAGAYAESALKLDPASSVVAKIATYLPVTDEQLEDVAYVAGYLQNRLAFMVRQRLDAQLLNGNGTAPNLRGLNNVVGIQTQAKGTDPTPDAFYKAMVKVMTVGQAFPTAHIINPLDWQPIRLLRTADGIYIWGSPSEAGPERLWGLNVALAQAQPQGTGILGDFTFCELAVRRDVDVQVSNSHSDYFTSGKQAIRADMRAAFPVYRPAAFATVTGL